MRMHVQGRIWRLVLFIEYSTHGHACELSSMLEGKAARSQASKS
jgi:hypothetical protein